jgi:uncharacterized protein (TIGR03083 family)
MSDSPSGADPAVILTALRGEAAAFEQYLAGLSDSDLARPSACEGWTVADVVAHLTWASGFFRDTLERGLRDDASPPSYLPPQGPERRRRIADLARETRAELGGSLRAEFARANRSLEAAFAGVGPADWDRPCAHRVGTLRRLAQTRLNELTVHCWDVRSVLEPPGHLREGSLPVLIDLIGRWFELLFTPDPSQERPWRVRFEYPPDGIASRDLVIGPTEVAFVPAADAPADVIVRADPQVTILMAMGRISLESVLHQYGGTVNGQAELLGLLGSRFGAV